MIPKFRMWHPKRKTMETVTTLEFHEDKGLDYICVGYDDFGYAPTDVVLMQSTGLKDKNGVEIFEGDVVLDCYYVPYEVRYNSDFCAFILYPLEDLEEITRIHTKMELEIIGNIYENPELVEVE